MLIVARLLDFTNDQIKTRSKANKVRKDVDGQNVRTLENSRESRALGFLKERKTTHEVDGETEDQTTCTEVK